MIRLDVEALSLPLKVGVWSSRESLTRWCMPSGRLAAPSASPFLALCVAQAGSRSYLRRREFKFSNSFSNFDHWSKHGVGYSRLSRYSTRFAKVLWDLGTVSTVRISDWTRPLIPQVDTALFAFPQAARGRGGRRRHAPLLELGRETGVAALEINQLTRQRGKGV